MNRFKSSTLLVIISLLGLMITGCGEIQPQPANLETSVSVTEAIPTPETTATETPLSEPAPASPTPPTLPSPPTATPTLASTSPPTTTPTSIATQPEPALTASATADKSTGVFGSGLNGEPSQTNLDLKPAANHQPEPTPCPFEVAPRFINQYRLYQQTASWGCPTDKGTLTNAAIQSFENGFMLWFEGVVYVIPNESTSLSNGLHRTWQAIPDTWDETQPANDPTLSPPEGLQQPVRGFGKVWREQSGGPEADIGWALAPEQGYQIMIQHFVGGMLINTPTRDVIALCDTCPPPISYPTDPNQPIWQTLTDAGDTFLHIASGPNNTIWGMSEDSLVRFSGSTWETYPLSVDFLDNFASGGWRWDIYDLEIGPDETAWIATTKGLYAIKSGLWVHHLTDKIVKDIAISPQGVVWVIGYNPSTPADAPEAGHYWLQRQVGETWEEVPVEAEPLKSIEKPEYVNLIITPQGDLWLSVWFHGVYRYDGQMWIQAAPPMSSPENWVFANRRGDIWIGGAGNQSWSQQTETGRKQPKFDFPQYPVKLMAVDEAGGAWGAVISSCYFCKTIDPNRVGAIYVNQNETCYFNAHVGLGGPPLNPQPSMFDLETPRPDAISDIAVAEDNSLWFITQRKITVFRPQKSVCTYSLKE